MSTRPLRIINSIAPIRICDNGGWTDTWFAGHGRIFNIAVSPYAQVQVALYPASERAEPLVIHAENYNEHYAPRTSAGGWDRHPLLEATVRRMSPPDYLALELHIFSHAPAGASTGTSAAVTVAIIGALDQLHPGRLTTHEVAYLAHAIETEDLGQQCGIQDQLCASYGGINYIDMFQYPHASVSRLELPLAIWHELEQRLLLIYLGKSHQSSKVHETVIRNLEHVGPTAQELVALRQTARLSRDALYAGDFDALGKAMILNTEAQRRLHADLVSLAAEKVISIARSHGALGWKVNGAGGDGGSLTILCSRLAPANRAMIREIAAADKLFRHIPIRLSRHGLRVWESSS